MRNNDYTSNIFPHLDLYFQEHIFQMLLGIGKLCRVVILGYFKTQNEYVHVMG